MPSAWYEISHIFQIKGQNSEVVSQGLNRGDFYKNIFHEIDPISIFFKTWAVLISSLDFSDKFYNWIKEY